MRLCPVAIAIGCRKCPILSICPAKGLIGDYRPDPDATQELPGPSKKRAKARRKR
jgi:hypothetical protein